MFSEIFNFRAEIERLLHFPAAVFVQRLERIVIIIALSSHPEILFAIAQRDELSCHTVIMPFQRGLFSVYRNNQACIFSFYFLRSNLDSIFFAVARDVIACISFVYFQRSHSRCRRLSLLNRYKQQTHKHSNRTQHAHASFYILHFHFPPLCNASAAMKKARSLQFDFITTSDRGQAG